MQIQFLLELTIHKRFHITEAFPFINGTSWTSFLEGSSPIAHKQVEDLEMDTLGNLWIITQTEGITVYKNGGVVGFDCIDRSLQACAPTGVIETTGSSDETIAVLENPFSFTTTIEFNLSETKNISISIYNLIGQEVKSITGKNLLKGKNRMEIDLSDLNTGVYFPKINSNENLQAVKLIKQ